MTIHPEVQNVLDDWRKRVQELKPAVEEHDALIVAINALEPIEEPPRRKPVTIVDAIEAQKAKPKAKTKRGRPMGSGKRDKDVLEVLAKKPGLTVSGIAAQLGMKPNYLYRVVPRLEREGKIKRYGSDGWRLS